MHIFIPVRKACYVPTSSRLGAVLMSWSVFGMSGPFLSPSALKRQQTGPGAQRKGPLLCSLAVIRKRTLHRSQDLPPRTPGCNVLPGLDSQCAVALAPGTRWAPNTLHFILLSPHTVTYGLACVCTAVNISSHIIIHILHLMQYLAHVLCITNVSFTAYK